MLKIRVFAGNFGMYVAFLERGWNFGTA